MILFITASIQDLDCQILYTAAHTDSGLVSLLIISVKSTKEKLFFFLLNPYRLYHPKWYSDFPLTIK